MNSQIIDESLQLIRSYLNARAAILRALEDKRVGPAALVDDLALGYDVLCRKYKNPETWRADELIQLRSILGLSADPAKHLKQLTSHVQLLLVTDRQRLLRETHIGKYRIKTLLKDYGSWRLSELLELSNFLNRAVQVSNQSSETAC